MKALIFALMISCLSFAQEAPLTIPATLQMAEDSSGFSITVDLLQVPKTAPFPLTIHADATIAVDGWIISSKSTLETWSSDMRIVDTIAAQFVNLERQDLLCKGASERIAGFGEDGPTWPEMTDFGYRVHKGDRVQVQLRVQTRGAESFTFEFGFQPMESGPFRRDAYPMWFNARGCGPVDFDLKPGKNISSGTFEIPVTGTIVALQGGLRENAEYLEVVNRSREITFLRQEWKRPAQPLPLVTPKAGTEFRVDQGDFIAVAAGYNNPSNKEAKDAGMGAALGLFVPVDDAKMAAFEKKKDAATAKATAAEPQN